MDNDVEQAVSDDDPMMIAWEKYRLSENGVNADKWAHFVKVSEPM